MVDAIACALLATADDACMQVIAPPYSTGRTDGARVLGTRLAASPVDAAFATGTLVRWLDFNDTWLAKEWGHPSDNLGGLLPLCDHLTRSTGASPTVTDLMTALVQAYEIQGALADGVALNRHGLDHTAFVRVATAAVATRLLGGARDQVAAAVAHAFADAGPLRVFRHAPNVTWRKSWAAGDAVARGVWLADHAMRTAVAPARPLTTPGWGLQEALLDGEPIDLEGPLGSTTAEGVLLKPWFPGEYHGHSSVEAGLSVRLRVLPRLDDVEHIEVATREAAVRIIDKRGPLTGHADRDHCLQYMLVIALLYGARPSAPSRRGCPDGGGQAAPRPGDRAFRRGCRRADRRTAGPGRARRSAGRRARRPAHPTRSSRADIGPGPRSGRRSPRSCP
ncbi:MAG TPA: MmgE/PrpD family protein [Nocardioidaceae bacterium]|nr:MmgE/PrpD family protein [Nocardioidaceae bacterium]